MRRSWMSSIAALLLSSCAAQVARAPASMPASFPADHEFVPVPKNWCAPIDGVFLTWEGVDNELLLRRRDHVACEMRVIDADEKREIAEARAQAAEVEAASNRSWWRLVGVPILTGVLGAAAGILGGYEAGRAHK
jgi:hypothetical protein